MANILQAQIEGMANEILHKAKIKFIGSTHKERMDAIQNATAEIAALKQLYAVTFAPMNSDIENVRAQTEEFFGTILQIQS